MSQRTSFLYQNCQAEAAFLERRRESNKGRGYNEIKKLIKEPFGYDVNKLPEKGGPNLHPKLS